MLHVLQYYPLEEVLAAEYLLEDFRPDLIEMVLDKLRPQHVRSVFKYNCIISHNMYIQLKNKNNFQLKLFIN